MSKVAAMSCRSFCLVLATLMLAGRSSQIAFGAADADAPAAESPPSVGHAVTVPSGDAQLACYLALPAGDKPAPAILLIHEWYGLNDWVKQQADRFARQGYVALAVDLYRGELATDADAAHQLMRGLADERALADIQAGFEYLAKHERTQGAAGGAPVEAGRSGTAGATGGTAGGAQRSDSTAEPRIGVIGWCMGGGYALKLGIAEPRVAATVVCYGKPVTDVEQLKRIRGPLLGIWGEKDRGIEIEPFRKALEQAGVKATHHVYPGAGHAFLNENNKNGYDKEQAEKAWKEIDGFFARTLVRARSASE